MKTITQIEAAEIKCCTREAIRQAVKSGRLNSIPKPDGKRGRLVCVDNKFDNYSAVAGQGIPEAAKTTMKKLLVAGVAIVRVAQECAVSESTVRKYSKLWNIGSNQQQSSPPPAVAITQAEAARRKECTVQTIINALKAGRLNVYTVGGKRLVRNDKTFHSWIPGLRRKAQTHIMPAGALSFAEAGRIKGCTGTAVLYALRRGLLNSAIAHGVVRVADDDVFRAWNPKLRSDSPRFKRIRQGRNARRTGIDTEIDKDVLTHREAARIKKCSPMTVYNAVRAGKVNARNVDGIPRVVDDGTFKNWNPKKIHRKKKR